MSLLLKEVRKLNAEAARTLEGADLRTDAELQSLTREDLRDLFPERHKFKLRKQIFEMLHNQRPIDLLLQEMRGFIPEESLRAAVTENGVLAEYLRILKDTKTQLSKVQTFLDAHIDLLGSISTNPPDLHRGFQASHPPNHQTVSLPKTSIMSSQFNPKDQYKAQDTPQGVFGSLAQPPSSYCVHYLQRVKCRIVVTGTTFDAHQQLLEKVKSNSSNLDLVCLNDEEDYQAIIIFCPIISRVGTDVEAAMRKVTDDKPVNLVLMEHKPEATSMSPMRTWQDDPKIVLHVYVFFHERKHGLLQCHQNEEAVSQIHRKLLEYSIKISPHTSGNSQDRIRRTSNSSKDSNELGPWWNPWKS